ncbi:MAG: SUMF1/EgtB/PvdO family nonheme iron enzyme [Pseudomonadales bacterium]|nr:SUMF1/EgtB/PvdO family nonheme iron enzyme [Pseudomonadales bacterium]
MDKTAALKALGLDENASTEDIQQALSAKKQDIAEKKAGAPTEALKAKFESLEAKLAEAELALSADSGRSQPAGDNGSLAGEIKQTGPSPLSQTKLADLPGLAPQDAAQVELQPGQIIASRYEIKELIGQGGMGAVYRAFDKNRDEDIAIKLLLPSLTKNERALERFLNEARVSSKLSHPNIVNVFDVQSEGDMYFLIMELLEGQDLRQVMDNQKAVERPFEIDDVKEYIKGISEGLAYAHQHTVHRDIKPENIWITEDQQIKLMDFGIAQLQSTSQRTQTGAAMGTAYYMAPEQLKGVKDIDGRADQYALAVLAYELLTGEVPAGAIEPIQSLRKDIPKGMAAAIMQALSPRPENRFADIQAFNQAIQSGKGGKNRKVKAATPATAANLYGGGPNKLAIAVVLLLFLGGGAFAWQQGWLNALKPLDKELIAQQKAEATKLLGQIKRLQRLLDDNLRDLDRDVSDAKRENSQRYATLQTWQDNAEDFISRSATLTDLQGELAVGEGYLRDDKTASKAVATLTQVKQGYEDLLSCFDNLEGFENQQTELKTLQSQWQGYGIGGDVADEVTATEKQMAEAVAQGKECQTVNLTRVAIAGYENLIEKTDPILVADKKAQQAKSDWQAYKKKYGLTGKSASAEQAQQHYDEAQQHSSRGELAASLPLYQQAAASWKLARQAPDVEAWVKEKEAEWVAANRKEAEEAAREKEAARIAKLVGKLVKIPGGYFRMGSNDGPFNERPAYGVNVESFYIQEHEVTWDQYRPCIEAGVCDSGNDQGWGKGSRPAINVSWNDIQTYIAWLNRQTGRTFRLPSEAEWEYAARARSSTKYSWGNSISCSQARYGNHNGDCGNDRKTVAVKSYSPNRFGLYDMHGNVAEWVQDCGRNGGYDGAPIDGRAWVAGGRCSERVLRGGSWGGGPDHLRSAYRYASNISTRSPSFGFRLVQER